MAGRKADAAFLQQTLSHEEREKLEIVQERGAAAPGRGLGAGLGFSWQACGFSK